MTLYCLIHIDCTGKTGSLLTHCMNHGLWIDLRHCAALESSLEMNCCIRAQTLLSSLSLLSLAWELNYCFALHRLLMFIKLPLLFDLSVKRGNDWCRDAALNDSGILSIADMISSALPTILFFQWNRTSPAVLFILCVRSLFLSTHSANKITIDFRNYFGLGFHGNARVYVRIGLGGILPVPAGKYTVY